MKRLPPHASSTVIAPAWPADDPACSVVIVLVMICIEASFPGIPSERREGAFVYAHVTMLMNLQDQGAVVEPTITDARETIATALSEDVNGMERSLSAIPYEARPLLQASQSDRVLAGRCLRLRWMLLSQFGTTCSILGRTPTLSVLSIRCEPSECLSGPVL